MSDLGDIVDAAMERKRQGQGMRQPQMGGIQSRLELTNIQPLCSAKHKSWWRLKGQRKWMCVVCHPPAPPAEEIEFTDQLYVLVDPRG